MIYCAFLLPETAYSACILSSSSYTLISQRLWLTSETLSSYPSLPKQGPSVSTIIALQSPKGVTFWAHSPAFFFQSMEGIWGF